MKRIELIGPTGVGKTTLFNKLLRQRKGNDAWLTPEEARVKVSREHYWNSARTPGDYFKYLILRLRALSLLHGAFTKNINPKKSLFANKEAYDEVSKLACAYAGSDSPSLLKIRNIMLIERDLEDISVLKTSSMPTPIVFNESLTQKIFQLLLISFSEEERLTLLPSLPLPDAFVYCYATPEIIAERLRERKKTTFHHRFLADKDGRVEVERDLHNLKTASVLLSKVGIKGIEINTALPCEKSVAELGDFIRNL